MIKNKKGSVNETSEGDAGVSTATTLSFIKLILLITIIIFLLVIVISKYIDAKAPVPTDLGPDLIVARLANVCFSTRHAPFEIIDQKVITESSFTLDNAQGCFKNWNSTKISKINLQWKSSNGLETKTIIVQDKKFSSLNLLYVLVKHDDGSVNPGTLAVYK